MSLPVSSSWWEWGCTLLMLLSCAGLCSCVAGPQPAYVSASMCVPRWWRPGTWLIFRKWIWCAAAVVARVFPFFTTTETQYLMHIFHFLRVFDCSHNRLFLIFWISWFGQIRADMSNKRHSIVGLPMLSPIFRHWSFLGSSKIIYWNTTFFTSLLRVLFRYGTAKNRPIFQRSALLWSIHRNYWPRN